MKPVTTTKPSASRPLIIPHTEVTSYDIYMDCNVTPPSSRYNDLLDVLNSANANQTIRMHLQNNGGSVDTYIRISNAMRSCKAKVNVIVEGPCYSAGALMALSGDSLLIQPCAYLMFHNYSVGFHKMKGDELTQYIDTSNKTIVGILKYHCSPFLTAKEIELLANDKDVYIHWDDADLQKRIQRHFKARSEASKRPCIERAEV